MIVCSHLLFVYTIVGKPLKGTFMPRDRPYRVDALVALALPFGRPLMRCFTKTIFLIIIYHESPTRGFFILLQSRCNSQVYSFYLPHDRILYIIYYASGSFLMNLGDSLGISIFSCTPVGAPRKSRLLPPFGVLGVGIAWV